MSTIPALSVLLQLSSMNDFRISIFLGVVIPFNWRGVEPEKKIARILLTKPIKFNPPFSRI